MALFADNNFRFVVLWRCFFFFFFCASIVVMVAAWSECLVQYFEWRLRKKRKKMCEIVFNCVPFSKLTRDVHIAQVRLSITHRALGTALQTRHSRKWLIRSECSKRQKKNIIKITSILWFIRWLESVETVKGQSTFARRRTIIIIVAGKADVCATMYYSGNDWLFQWWLKWACTRAHRAMRYVRWMGWRHSNCNFGCVSEEFNFTHAKRSEMWIGRMHSERART